MKHFEFYIGIAAGILTSLAALPQLIKLVKEKHAEDISLTMFVVLVSGLALWTWYGFLKDDMPIIITNLVSLGINLAVIFCSIRYKKKQ